MADDLAKIKARLHGGITKLPNADRPSVIQQAKDKAKESAEALLKAHARQLALQNRAFEPGSVTKVRDPQALSEMAGDMLAGPLSFMPAGIIKEKGGNWLGNTLNYTLDELKSGIHRSPTEANETALRNWIDSNLKNYVKKQMGTQEDPVRALAEQGISHLPPNSVWDATVEQAYSNRIKANAPDNAPLPLVGQHPLAQQWENIADASIRPTKADLYQKPLSKTAYDLFGTRWKQVLEQEPWLQKLEPNTKVYEATGGMHYDTGFDHIVDVLNQQLASGQIRPEQLNKVSMADAVMRAHLFDQEMAKKMAQAKLQAQTEMPVHKDYGESGYKWYELKHPTNDEITEQALKYEGDTMGHCVGGYCPDVLAGRTKIYSLRDAKGEPHVTIEAIPYAKRWHDVPEEIRNTLTGDDLNQWIKNNPTLSIRQIKGKQNAAPKDEYLPYVQDFVKSGNWSGNVGDLYNAKLYDTGNMSELANITPQNELLQDLHKHARFSILNRAEKAGKYPTDRFITRDEYENLLLENRPPEIPD